VKKISYVNKNRSSIVLALRELRLMRQLSKHENIVTIYGAEVISNMGQSDLWLAMELLSIDLQQLIDSKQVRHQHYHHHHHHIQIYK
jgi:serine/threonine protein kinase